MRVSLEVMRWMDGWKSALKAVTAFGRFFGTVHHPLVPSYEYYKVLELVHGSLATSNHHTRSSAPLLTSLLGDHPDRERLES